MQFAINYSHPSAQLLSAGRLKVDRFKCPPWPDLIAEAQAQRPAAVHFNLKAGRGKLNDVDWDQITEMLDHTDTPYVNVHLETRAEDLPGTPIDTTEPLHRQQIAEWMFADLRQVIHRFGAERVIAENVPYRPAGNVLRPCVEPQLICEVIQAAGCGLLLDIAHARISASHLGLSVDKYMSSLPVDRLRELHFSGVNDLDGWLQDHMPAVEQDWSALRSALEQIQSGAWQYPWLLAFEYGGVGEKFVHRSDPLIIEEQARQIWNWLQLV
jgi:uncharacterized protein (UPF0276 family)